MQWVAVMLLVLSTCLPALAETDTAVSLRIQSVVYDAQQHSVNLVAQDDAQFPVAYQTIKLTHPDRMMIDFPGAYLATKVRNLPVHQDGIDHIELSQSLGTFYQVTRLTLVADSAEALANLKVTPSGNRMTVYLPGSAPVVQAMTQAPLPPIGTPSIVQAPSTTLNTLQSVSFEEGSLRLFSDKGSALVVKNQFTLTAPNRLVVDLANTALANRSLSKPMAFSSGPIRSIRLGQFDESTVRVVVETSRPNAFYLTYPGSDRSQLALASHLVQSTIRSLPTESQQVGVIQDINLSKRDDTSILKISTSDPMVRRLVRRQDEIEVDLINIVARPTIVAYDKQLYPEIQEIRLTPLNADEPNTRLIIKLNNASVELDSRLSLDGRAMELVFSPRSYNYSAISSRLPLPQILKGGESDSPQTITIVRPSSLPRGNFTVVVDAGHGGKDLGANRVGVNEKDLNLSVALKLRRALEAKGVTVKMTRDVDKFLELSQICAITNGIRPDAFISVHTNASVSPVADGLETYYFTPQSRQLAQSVHRRAVNLVNAPDRGVRTARFYVVHHTTVPAVLFEMGYVSNTAERAALQTDERQNATAEALAQGVVEFLGRSLKAEALPQGETP